jgi:hypothetical protein
MKQEKTMKKGNEDIEKKVQKTMQLLDEIKPLEVHHLFRVRLMQQIEQDNSERSLRKFFAASRHLDFRLAFMALLIVINIGSAMISLEHQENPTITGISERVDSLNDDDTSPALAYYDQADS